MRLIYFKDSFLPPEQCHISLNDRSFRFGDGLFETMLVVNSRIYHLGAHIRRLENGLNAFRITLDIAQLPAVCTTLIHANNLLQGYIRVIVSRGHNPENAVGYLPTESVPYMIIHTLDKPYPATYALALWVSSHQATFKSPAKSNNALVYTLAMLEAQDNQCGNALLLDSNHILCETASGNIFWIKNNILYTPSDDLMAIPGTIAEKVKELWQDTIIEGHFVIEDLYDAEEIFMTNLGCLIAPVTSIQPLGILLPEGPRTQRLRIALDADIKRATTP